MTCTNFSTFQDHGELYDERLHGSSGKIWGHSQTRFQSRGGLKLGGSIYPNQKMTYASGCNGCEHSSNCSLFLYIIDDDQMSISV